MMQLNIEISAQCGSWPMDVRLGDDIITHCVGASGSSAYCVLGHLGSGQELNYGPCAPWRSGELEL